MPTTCARNAGSKMLARAAVLLLISTGETPEHMPKSETLTRLFLAGDVMTGRGIDQALPWPGNPALFEPHIRDARAYVELAERASGPINCPVSFNYIWGDARAVLHEAAPDARIINLETAITKSNDCWAEKGIHYRMNPRNIGCLTSAGISACALANNHILDWGYAGLTDSLDVLDQAGIARAGAGRNAAEASAPAVIKTAGQSRILLFSYGSLTSGIPAQWQAQDGQAGVNLLKNLSAKTAGRAVKHLQEAKQPGDLAVASIHWGGNWGYEIPRNEILFARQLIEGGFDLVYGHSSHHAKAFEVFKGRLILYGCGDFINDYEGISGLEDFRPDLRLLYLAALAPDGLLVSLEIVPMQVKRFQLHFASRSDAAWLANMLNTTGKQFGTELRTDVENDAARLCYPP